MERPIYLADMPIAPPQPDPTPTPAAELETIQTAREHVAIIDPREVTPNEWCSDVQALLVELDNERAKLADAERALDNADAAYRTQCAIITALQGDVGRLTVDLAHVSDERDEARDERDTAAGEWHRQEQRADAAEWERDDLRIDQAGKKDHIRVLAERLIELEAAIVKTRRERDGARQCNDNQAAALRRVQDLANRYDAVCAGGPLKSYRAAEIRAALAGPATPPAQTAQDSPADAGGATGQGEAAEGVTEAADWREWLATDICDAWPHTPMTTAEMDAAQDALDTARDEIDPPHTPEHWQAAVAAADRLLAEVHRTHARPAPGLAAQRARELLADRYVCLPANVLDLLRAMLTELDGEYALRQRSDRARHSLAQGWAERGMEIQRLRQELATLRKAVRDGHAPKWKGNGYSCTCTRWWGGAESAPSLNDVLDAWERHATGRWAAPDSDATRETAGPEDDTAEMFRRGWVTGYRRAEQDITHTPAGLDVDEIIRQIERYAGALHFALTAGGSPKSLAEFAALADATLTEIRRLLEAVTPQPEAVTRLIAAARAWVADAREEWAQSEPGILPPDRFDRELVAAVDALGEPEAAPQPRQPRVWHAGDPQPGRDVRVVVDDEGRVYDRETVPPAHPSYDLWRGPDLARHDWYWLTTHAKELTEVIPDAR